MSTPLVPLTTMLSAAPSPVVPERPGELDVDSIDIRPGQVVDGDEVGAAEGVEVDPFDAGRVHRDRALGAEELEPVAVRREANLLGHIGAVEAQPVGSGPAFDDVAAVAGIPDENVVTCAQEGAIVAAVSIDHVVSVTRRVASRLPSHRAACRRHLDRSALSGSFS